MNLGEEIGNGNYRVCYAIKNSDLIVKINRKFVYKKLLGVKIPIPAFLFTFLKFGTFNPNEREYNILQKLPNELSPYLPEYIKLENGNLIQNRPKDYTGNYSATVISLKSVTNDSFWKHVKIIEELFVKHDFYPLDIFRGGGNVIVQKISFDEWKPILIDIKRVGYRPIVDSLDFKLIFKSEQKKKFSQRLAAFKLLYNK